MVTRFRAATRTSLPGIATLIPPRLHDILPSDHPDPIQAVQGPFRIAHAPLKMLDSEPNSPHRFSKFVGEPSPS